MGISVVTPPTSDPLSLIEAKDHLHVTETDQDGLIAGYILAAREFVENSTHLRLVTQTLDLTVDDGWPVVSVRGVCRTRIEFPVKPVQSVTSVTYVDGNGAPQTLAADQYTLSKDGAVHFIEPAYGVTWPTTRCQTAAITVRFVAGYAQAEVPPSLLQAIRWLVGHQYENREAVSAGTLNEIPLGLEAMISQHRFSRF